MEENLTVNYNWLAERQQQLNTSITANQVKDPKQQDKALNEQNLMNVGAMQMISEIIQKFKK